MIPKSERTQSAGGPRARNPKTSDTEKPKEPEQTNASALSLAIDGILETREPRQPDQPD